MNNKAVYQALIYILEYIADQTPEQGGETYGHPARQIIENLLNEQDSNQYPDG